MPYHKPLLIGGKIVAFDHLEPLTLVAPTTTKPAGVRIDIVFSNHCFSEAFDSAVHTGDVVDIWDGRVRRVFDQVRYNLSAALPGIVQGLPDAHVFRTPEANFVRITTPLVDAPGADYRMFFRLKKERGGDHDLRMVVESAYSPTPGQALAERDMTKIRFKLLVDKTLKGEPISRHYKR